MSEQRGMWVIYIIACLALMGVIHYRAQIRNLQRRVAVLETGRR